MTVPKVRDPKSGRLAVPQITGQPMDISEEEIIKHLNRMRELVGKHTGGTDIPTADRVELEYLFKLWGVKAGEEEGIRLTPGEIKQSFDQEQQKIDAWMERESAERWHRKFPQPTAPCPQCGRIHRRNRPPEWYPLTTDRLRTSEKPTREEGKRAVRKKWGADSK